MSEDGETASTDLPRYEITASDVTVEALVIQVDGKTIIKPLDPVVVHAGESLTISEGARPAVLAWDDAADDNPAPGDSGEGQ